MSATATPAAAGGAPPPRGVPQQMSGALMSSPGQVGWRNLNVPRPGPGELLVRVEASGICGSDVAAYQGTHPYKRAPIVLGHEFAGTVSQTGPGVSRVRVGERVCAQAFSPCGRCEQCHAGRPQLCPKRTNLSAGAWHGSFAEYVLLAENMVYALPPAVSSERAALVEPLAIAVHAARISAQPKRPRTAVALGGGTIGLSCLVAARELYGAVGVALDLGATKRQLALSVGVEHFIDNSTPEAITAVHDLLCGCADVTFLASGHAGALDQAINCTRPGGTVVAVAFFTEPASVLINDMLRREVSLRTASLCTPADIETALEWAARGELAIEPLITHRFPLSQAGCALRLITTRRGEVGKVILHAPGETAAL